MTVLEKNCRALATTFNRLNSEIAATESEVQRVQSSADYSESYKKQIVGELTEKRDRVTRENTEAMQRAVDQAVASIQADHKIDLAHDAAHQIAVSNALKMVELGGKNLTPQQLQGLANTFIEANDQQTLDLLRTICLNRCPDAFHIAFGENIEDNASRIRLFGTRLVRGMGSSFGGAIYVNLAQQFLNDSGMGDITLEA